MKGLPAGLSEHIAEPVTSLCLCWKVTLVNGTVLGFTDHDRLINFGGVAFEPSTGFSATAADAALGLSIPTREIEGALSSDRIRHEDVVAGLWDDAAVEEWIVDWSNVTNRIVNRAGSIGEVSFTDTVFRAELRGLSHRLNQERGRVFSRTCDAAVGDGRCGVDIGDDAFTKGGTVAVTTTGRVLRVTGIGGQETGFFDGGVLTWLTGENAGLRAEVRRHQRIEGAPNLIELWRPMPRSVEAGDTFTISAGCDKSFATCKAKFSNVANFRGFPHMPGNDAALQVAKSDEIENDGGSMFR